MPSEALQRLRKTSFGFFQLAPPGAGRDLGTVDSRAHLIPLPEHSGHLLLAEAVALALDGDDVAVEQEAVQDRRGHHGVPEPFPPVPYWLVAREDDAAAFMPAVRQLEQEAAVVPHARI